MMSRSILRAGWFSIVILLVLTLLIPTVFVSPQVHAQGPYDDLAAEMQMLRQQMAELLASYQSMDAQGRAMMDSAMGDAARQALQQMYGALSAGDRAVMDGQLRQATGYTFPQLAQSMSTIPGLVRTIDALIAGLGYLSGGGAAVTPQPVNPDPPVEPETKTVTLTLYVHANLANGPFISGAQVSGQDGKGKPFSLATNSGGYVTITGAKGMWSFSASGSGYNTNAWRQTINTNATRHAFLVTKGLAWQLFPGTKMSDADARKKLQENVELRKGLLTKSLASAEKNKADLEKARDAKNLDVYIDNLEIQLAVSKSGRVEALDQFFQTVGSEARNRLIDALPDTLDDKSTQAYAILKALAAGTNAGLDSYPALKTIDEKIKKKGELTTADWIELGEASIDMIAVINDGTAKSKTISFACTGAKLTSKLLDLAGAQMEVDTYQTALQQLSSSKQYNELVFQHKIDVAAMKILEYQRQLERLKSQPGYIDPKYLDFK
jgi:hypothetical protein